MVLAVRMSSYGCTWKLWRAFKKLGLPSAAPRATLTHLSWCPNFLPASITRYTHAKHEQILKSHVTRKKIKGMIKFPVGIIVTPLALIEMVQEMKNSEDGSVSRTQLTRIKRITSRMRKKNCPAPAPKRSRYDLNANPYIRFSTNISMSHGLLHNSITVH